MTEKLNQEVKTCLSLTKLLNVQQQKESRILMLRPCVVCVCVHVVEMGRVQLTALEQQDGYLSQVKVDEVARLVGNVGAEVASDNAVPCWVVFFVKLFLDECGDVLRAKMKREKF